MYSVKWDKWIHVFDYNTKNTCDISDVHKYLTKTKQVFITLLNFSES